MWCYLGADGEILGGGGVCGAGGGIGVLENNFRVLEKTRKCWGGCGFRGARARLGVLGGS